MKHLKLLEPGFANMTGPLGAIEFVNGVSKTPVSAMDAARISASMRAEYVEGGNPSVSGQLVETKDKQAEVKTGMRTSDSKTGVEKYIEKLAATTTALLNVVEKDATPEKQASQETGDKQTYTQEELEFIADTKGIVGLREVADKFDVKGNSIAAIIQKLVKKFEG